MLLRTLQLAKLAKKYGLKFNYKKNFFSIFNTSDNEELNIISGFFRDGDLVIKDLNIIKGGRFRSTVARTTEINGKRFYRLSVQEIEKFLKGEKDLEEFEQKAKFKSIVTNDLTLPFALLLIGLIAGWPLVELVLLEYNLIMKIATYILLNIILVAFGKYLAKWNKYVIDD